jgi:hypothetical protein
MRSTLLQYLRCQLSARESLAAQKKLITPDRNRLTEEISSRLNTPAEKPGACNEASRGDGVALIDPVNAP